MLADEDAGEKGKKGERVGKRDWGRRKKKKRARLDRYACTGWDGGKWRGGPDRVNFFSSFKEIFLVTLKQVIIEEKSD